MGVYIEGMEMPKEGSWVTLRVFPDGQCLIYSYCGNDFDFMEHLTAVPVHEPHGRLIDADALVHSYYRAPSFPNLCKAINEASTIIPAEEVE